MAPLDETYDILVSLSDRPGFAEARQAALTVRNSEELGSLTKVCIDKCENPHLLMQQFMDSKHGNPRVTMHQCIDNIAEREERKETLAWFLDMAARNNNRKRRRADQIETGDQGLRGADQESGAPSLQEPAAKRKTRSSRVELRPEESTDSHDDRSSTLNFGDGEGMHPSREQGASYGSRATQKQVPVISMSLIIPNNAGYATVKPLTAFSRNLQQQLTNKFNDDYIDTENHRSLYITLLELKDRHAGDECCVNNVVYRKRGSPMMWQNANGMKKRTCDFCIKQKRLCARLVRQNDEVVLMVYALPATFRLGKEAHELAFWVQD